MKKENKTPVYEGVRPLADDELERVSGGAAEDDPNADQAAFSDAELDELRALTGDPEALNKKLAELQAQGRLINVVEQLSGSTAGTAPAEEGVPAENTGGMVVHHNAAAMKTLEQLSKTRVSQTQSLAKLSTGMKINSAADDPSGYQISERMRVQIRALDQANYNAQNGRSMLKVAEGAVSSTVEILRTLKEKVIKAVNDTNTEVDRAAIQKEIDASIAQIDDNALLTFNGKKLNNGARDANGEQRADAASVLDAFTEGISARNEAADNSAALQIGANANQAMNLSLDDMSASALGLSGKGATVSVADKTQATAALKVIDNALQRALNQEAAIGAAMNRLEFTSNNLTTSSENLQSAESTYRDADMAKEMKEFTKNNILMQAATAMLSQANQQNQGVLSLLQ